MMKHWENWQKIAAAIVATFAVLGGLYAGISNYVGMQRDVEELGNDVAELSTPASAKADMCKETHKALIESYKANDSASVPLSHEMERMGCYSLAVDTADNDGNSVSNEAFQR